jgi:hypothetical protein
MRRIWNKTLANHVPDNEKETGPAMHKDNSGKPDPKKPEPTLTLRKRANKESVGIEPSKDDRITRFQKRRSKIGNGKAALETGLTIEELCSILEKENQEAMSIAVEAWDKLLHVRLSLVAMRGNPNQGDLEQIIKDIGTILSPFPRVDLQGDE